MIGRKLFKTNSFEQKKYIYYFKRAKVSIFTLVFLCIFTILVKYCGDFITNIMYSIIAAIIFYIITVCLPQYKKEIKYSEFILTTLSKISSIVETYSNYMVTAPNINCNSKQDIIKCANMVKSKVLNTEPFNKKCLFIANFNNYKYLNDHNGFCGMVKSQFIHHYNELTSIFNYVDKDVLSVLLKLRGNIDKINKIIGGEIFTEEKKAELCCILSQCAQVNAEMKVLIDNKYSMISECLGANFESSTPEA